MKTLYDLFVHELKDLYSAADYLVQVLHRMSCAATKRELSQMFATYYEQARYQKQKLKEFFFHYSVRFESANCLIMSKLRDHAHVSMRYKGSKEIRDVVLILTLNMMKHFEKTAFGTLLAHARRMKHEEIVDMLLTLKKKIAEEENEPVKLAAALLKSGEYTALKQEAETLLGTLLKTQVDDEEKLLEFLPQLLEGTGSTRIEEALLTYQKEHQEYLEWLKQLLPKFSQGLDIAEWKVIEGFAAEWKTNFCILGSRHLKDIGVILTIQRIQHQNTALFQMEALLSQFIGDTGMEKKFRRLIEQEMGNDQSFAAVAEGSFFAEGLDATIKP